jgi:hypothetical protein
MITKNQYIEWKSTEVTQQMEQDITEAVEVAAAEILVRRQSDPLDDQYLKGFIRGVQAAKEWEPEFEED